MKSTRFTERLNFEKELKSTVWGREHGRLVESRQSRPCCFGPVVHAGDEVDRIGDKVDRVGDSVDGDKLSKSSCCMSRCYAYAQILRRTM